jgi:hypothetical protein
MHAQIRFTIAVALSGMLLTIACAPASAQSAAPAAVEASADSDLGVLAQLIGTTYVYEDPMGLDVAMRLEWVEPGKSVRVMIQNGGPWHEFYRFVPASEPRTFATVYAEEGYPPSTATAAVLSDGRFSLGYGITWVLVDGLLHEQYSDGTDHIVYYPNTPEGLARRPPNKRTPPEWLTKTPEQLAAESNAQAMKNIDFEGSEAERMAKAAAWEAQAGQAKRELDESLQNLNDTVANIQTQGRAADRASVASSSNAGARQQSTPNTSGLTRDASEASPSFVATRAPEPQAGPGAPLRFILSIGLQPRAGDTVNPTCYSNVITRPGPAGWGQRGFLPPESAKSAHATVQATKSSFIAACRAASGRDVTSDGDFHWTWNETTDGESQIANTHAQYREDVTVGL